jgi:DNA-binding transcriptional ArsR family regulator
MGEQIQALGLTGGSGNVPCGQEQPDDSDGDVDEEHGPPAGPGDEQAAHDGTGPGGDARYPTPHPERLGPGTPLGVGGLKQGQGGGYGHGGTETLDQAGHDQHDDVRGQPAAGRGHDEERHTRLEHRLGAEPVAEGAGREKEARQDEGVAVHHPLQPGRSGVQVPPQAGQGHVDHRGVQDHHEVAGADGGQRFSGRRPVRPLAARRHATQPRRPSLRLGTKCRPRRVGGVGPIPGDTDIAAVAAVLADQSRAKMVLALGDGRALAATTLAAEAGVAASTASVHLAKLTDAGLLDVEAHGRHRYYRLSGPHVAELVEALARLAPASPVRSLREGSRAHAMRSARTCYDHLAG